MSLSNIGKGLLILNDKKGQFVMHGKLTVGNVYKILDYRSSVDTYHVVDDSGRMVGVKATGTKSNWFAIVDIHPFDISSYENTLKAMNDRLIAEDRKAHEPTLEELTRAIDYSLDTKDEDLFLFLHSELNRLGYNN